MCVWVCKSVYDWGWGFSSVVELLPSKCKALGSVLSSKKKKRVYIWLCVVCVTVCVMCVWYVCMSVCVVCVYECVCVCVCVTETHVYVQVLRAVPKPEDQKRNPGVMICLIPFRQGLSLNLELGCQPASPRELLSLPPSPSAKVLSYRHLCHCVWLHYISSALVWGCQIPWHWSYRQLWAAMWVLEIEPRSYQCS